MEKTGLQPKCFGRPGGIIPEEQGRLVRYLGWWPNLTAQRLAWKPDKGQQLLQTQLFWQLWWIVAVAAAEAAEPKSAEFLQRNPAPAVQGLLAAQPSLLPLRRKKMLKQLQNEPEVPKEVVQTGRGEKKKTLQKLKKQLQQHQTLQKGTSLEQVHPVLILIQTPVLDPVLILVDEEHEGTGIPAQIRPSNPAPLLAVEFSTFFRAKTSKPQQLQQRLFPFWAEPTFIYFFCR